MAARRNVFALLEVDDDGDSLLSLASTVAVQASSVSSFVSSSSPQRNSDRERGSDKWHGSERNNRNNVEANGYRKNNGGGRSSNGYQRKVEITNGNQKKEGQTEDEDGWQVVSKSNGKKPRKAAMDDHHLRFESEREDERGAGEENDIEKSPSPTEKEVQKPNNAGSQGGETESSKGNDDDNKVVSKEETERRALEARQMTLKQYEKKLEEEKKKKKKKNLENMKTEERRVALDKELESMQMIERNMKETSFMKNFATDKLKHNKKKKAADNGNAHMVKYLLVPPRRPRRNDGGSTPAPVIVKEDAPPPLSFQDANQFPALGPLDDKVKARIVGRDRFEPGYVSSGSEHSAHVEDDVMSPSLSELFFGFGVNGDGESSPETCDSDSETDPSSFGTSCRNVDLIKPIELDRTDEFRNVLAAHVSKAVQIYSAGKSDRQVLRRNVMAFLRNCGYNAAICKTKWESCGGLTAGSYEFIDVLTAEHLPARYFVDLDFASEFEIARPTNSYERLIQCIPRIFVGRIEDLKRILKVASDAAKRSLKNRGLHLPPWRKHRFMQNKWLGPYRRTTNAVTASYASQPDRSYAVKCRAVGFDAAVDGGRLLIPAASRTR